MSTQTQKPTLSNQTSVLMLGVALLYDVLSIIPFVGLVITPVAWLHFWLWFKLNGIDTGFKNPKRVFTFAGSSLVEASTLLSVFPSWVVAIGLQIVFTRVKSRAAKTVPGRSRVSSSQPRVRDSVTRRTALRQPGRRVHPRGARRAQRVHREPQHAPLPRQRLSRIPKPAHFDTLTP